jgi:DNA-binding transcriptional MerR regulator
VTEVTLKVGDVARETGVSPRLLRYYEEQGLLAPGRSSSGQRLYVPDDVERVARIRRLLEAGLSTNVIAQVLACACGGTGDVEPCLDPVLRDELDHIDARLARLAEHRGHLADLIDARAEARDAARTAVVPGRERREHDPALLLAPRRAV